MVVADGCVFGGFTWGCGLDLSLHCSLRGLLVGRGCLWLVLLSCVVVLDVLCWFCLFVCVNLRVLVLLSVFVIIGVWWDMRFCGLVFCCDCLGGCLVLHFDAFICWFCRWSLPVWVLCCFR